MLSVESERVNKRLLMSQGKAVTGYGKVQEKVARYCTLWLMYRMK